MLDGHDDLEHNIINVHWVTPLAGEDAVGRDSEDSNPVEIGRAHV